MYNIKTIKMITIPSGLNLNRPIKQRVPREQLPAFSTNSDVKYTLTITGLDINITLAPCRDYDEPGLVKDFTLYYDPSRFWPGSLIRRALGRKKLSYTSKDIRFCSHSNMFGVGDTFKVFLKHPNDTERTLDDGPLMMISRENGRIYFYPPYTDVDSPFPKKIISELWTETQQAAGKKFDGRWHRIHNVQNTCRH